MKHILINRTLEPPEYMPSKREIEQEDFEERAVNHVRTTYSPDEVFDLYLHDKEVALNFFKWMVQYTMDWGAAKIFVRDKKYPMRMTLEEIWEIYITETENKPNKDETAV